MKEDHKNGEKGERKERDNESIAVYISTKAIEWEWFEKNQVTRDVQMTKKRAH